MKPGDRVRMAPMWKCKEAFGKILNIPLTEKTKSVWYPHKEQDDTKNVEFTDE